MKRMVWKRWAPPLVLLALFLLLVVRLNQVDKVALVSREGQTFEKGVVTEILQDNVQPDGSRVGEQVVRVLMKTGELKGREIETTSSSGFLFGAPCTVGMKVVVMQSLAGDTVVSSVYAQDREFQILELLMQNPGNLISAERLMEKIWGYDSETEISVVWVYISYLRKKLSALGANIQIRATRNVGYCLEEIA